MSTATIAEPKVAAQAPTQDDAIKRRKYLLGFVPVDDLGQPVWPALFDLYLGKYKLPPELKQYRGVAWLLQDKIHSDAVIERLKLEIADLKQQVRTQNARQISNANIS